MIDIKDIALARIQKGDMLVLKFDRVLGDPEVDEIYCQMTTALEKLGYKEGEILVMLLDNGEDIQIVRKNETNQASNGK